MAGFAGRFARYGGIPERRPILFALLISGGLAGLAGAVEVLGVHYRFVDSFSAVSSFDGVIVALLGQIHPLGVALAAIFLGGIRAGALTGLQIQTGVPREMGGALIALMLLFLSARRLGISPDRLARRLAGRKQRQAP
jgi:simple sugar transport system permease protein